MVAVVDARDYHQAGETMEVAFNMNKAHFFDVETEEVIRKKPIEEVVETTL